MPDRPASAPFSASCNSGYTKSDRPGVSARQVVLSAAALWLCYFTLITLRGLVADLSDFSELLWQRALVTLIGIAITC